MPMYNVLEYSKNNSKTFGFLWNYYRDEPNNPPINFVTNPSTVIRNADRITNSASFKYKNRILGKTPNNDNNDNSLNKNVEIVLQLKHLDKFWDSLTIPLVNCELSLTLTCFKNCVLTDLTTTTADATANPPVVAINTPTNATFKITDTKCSSSYFFS